MNRILIFSMLALFLASCQKDSSSNWNTLDLLDRGFPISVLAPDSAKVNIEDNMGVLQDITIDSPEDNYHIQIYASDASTDDIAIIKAELISDVRNNPFFTKVIEEDDKGFIYEIMIDSVNYYSFRHVHVQGNTEFIFQTGIANTFNLEEAEKLRKAVRQGEEE